MVSKKAIAHFRQLCSLGLPAESLLPAALEHLHQLVPSLHNRVVWCDEQRRLTSMYCEATPMYAYGRLFLENFDNRLNDFPGTEWALRQPARAWNYRPIVTSTAYFRGLYYNEIERPVDSHHFLDLNLADSRGSLGMIILSRERSAQPFQDEEVALLDELQPYLVHGMRSAARSVAANEWPAGQGLLIVDRGTKIHHASDRALQWVQMALRPQARQGPLMGTPSTHLPPPLRALCESLDSLLQRRPARPPGLCIDNAWGRFQFAAVRLHESGQAPRAHSDLPQDTGLIAIHVNYSEAKEVAAMRSMARLGLTTAQKRLCLASLADNCSEPQLGAKLGVRTSTVRDHLSKLYRKLNVHSRSELMTTLLAPGRA